MTPQEKLDWFWIMGEVPGTIFDDWNDREPKVLGQPRRRLAKRRQHGLPKRHEEPSKHDGSRIELKASS